MKLYSNIIVTFLLGIAALFGHHTPAQTPAPAPLLGAYNISGGGTYHLKSSAGSTDSTIQLSSFKEPVSNLPYSMTYLNTTVSYGTIDPQTDHSEFISFTGITQNSDTSATLTGVSRGLLRSIGNLGCIASTTLALRHAGQSVFILSDSPCHFAQYTAKANDEAVTGTWTFPEPTNNSNPATKNYVDTHVNGGTVSVDKVVVAATAGETFYTGQIVYLDIYQGAKWYKASATNASTTENVLIGIAQSGGSAGVSINGGVLLHGLDATQSTMTAGTAIYLSNTAGATSTSVGTNGLQLGVARTATGLYFDPHVNRSYVSNATTTNLYISGSCNGCVNTNIQDFTASGIWTKPSYNGTASVSHIMVIAVGAGGSGGGGCACTGSLGSAGGGGGAVNIKYFDATKLPTRVWVQVGTTTAAGVAGSVVTSGGNGTPSFFGTSSTNFFVFAGGGGGGKYVNGANFTTWGGAGGGWLGVNALASTTVAYAASTTALSGQSVDGNLAGHAGEWGGGSGAGFASSTALGGGCSLFGGGGGGGTAFQGAGAAGGGTGCYSASGGGAGSTAPANATAGVSATSTGGGTYAGTGGGGGGAGSNSNTSGGAGGAGGYPGGGGGGGSGADPGGTAVAGAGGVGAPGWVRVLSW